MGQEYCREGHPVPPGEVGCLHCAQLLLGEAAQRSEPTSRQPQETVIAPSAALSQPLWGWLYTFDLRPQGTSFRLTQGIYTIGSDPAQAQICLPSTAEVAPYHALLEVYPDGCSVRDAGSPQGTLINNVSVPVCHGLGDGDYLTVGAVQLVICTRLLSSKTPSSPTP